MTDVRDPLPRIACSAVIQEQKRQATSHLKKGSLSVQEDKKLGMTAEEQAVWDEAIRFARSNKKTIGKRLTDRDRYPPETEPVSVFMAGSPGAGKTEASLALLNFFCDTAILRIDPDELRNEFEGYQGGNAWLFQGAISILVGKLIDLALDRKQSFLLDGTLSNIQIARSNVERCLSKGRFVQIL